MQPISNPFVEVLHIETWTDFLYANLYVGGFYYVLYLVAGTILEYTNPIPKSPERVASMKKQIKMGLISLFSLILYTTIWMWKFDKLTPYYGYWAGRENQFGLWELAKNIFVYMFVFDTWFTLTHHFLHIDWLMQNVHRHHHQFIEPTAFGQDAVHPFESILQGPMGHFMCTFFYPMNPLVMSTVGFLTSIYALLAHDGRALDLNDHTKHHWYRNCNFALYWGFWDYVFGTRYSKAKYPVEYIPSWVLDQRNKEKGITSSSAAAAKKSE